MVGMEDSRGRCLRVRRCAKPAVPRPYTGSGYKNTANRLAGNGPMDDTTRKIEVREWVRRIEVDRDRRPRDQPDDARLDGIARHTARAAKESSSRLCWAMGLDDTGACRLCQRLPRASRRLQ